MKVSVYQIVSELNQRELLFLDIVCKWLEENSCNYEEL